MKRLTLALVFGALAVPGAFLPAAGANIIERCECEPARPQTLLARECGLCREAEKQPAGEGVFYLKDINPTKPNRWLALPRTHEHSLAAMTPAERTALWTAAIAKGKELFGDHWGLALNGRRVITQCHVHVHIGKLLPGIETDNFIIVNKPEDIPLPVDEGFWIHPQGAQFHVHRGEQITETVLLR